jgi:Arc/MetJ family transcription regulator
MRTNVVLDDKLVEEALKLGRKRTKKELIYEALKEYVDTRKRLDLTDLAGKVRFRKDCDYKAMREGK